MILLALTSSWSATGRRAFVVLMLLASSAIAGGPDKQSFDVAVAPVLARRCFDCHNATAEKGLHLLELDHERLTYRYAGRDFRLTDVEGNVVTGVLA